MNAWLVHAGLGGSILLILGLLWQSCLRAPAARQRIGESGLLAALLLAALALGPRWLSITWPVTIEVPSAARPVVEDAEAAPMLWETASAVPVVEPMAMVEPRVPVDWPRLLLGGYVAGAAFFALRLLVGMAWLRHVVKHARPASGDVRQWLGDGARVRVLTSPRVRMPISFGIVTPTIVLPGALAESATALQLRWIGAHEATHLRRGDPWSGWLFAVGQVLFYPLPWFWSLRRQVRLCQEYIADAEAAGAAAAEEYAEFLLQLSKVPAAPLLTTAVSGNSSDLYRRVTMLLKNPVQTNYARRRVFAGAAGLLTLAIVGAGIGLSQEVIIITPDGQVQRITPNANPNPGPKPVVPAPATQPPPATRAQSADPAQRAQEARQEQADVQRLLETILHKLNDPQQKVDLQKIREEVARAVKQIHDAKPGKGEWKFDIDLILNDKGAVEKVRTQALEAARAAEAEARAQADRTRAQADELRRVLEAWQKSGKGDVEALQRDIQALVNQQRNKLANYRPVPYSKFVLGQHQGRLGARLERPGEALAEQLNLPQGQGLVVTDVAPGAKSGLRVNDVLLKLNQQPVPNEPAALAKMLNTIKEDAIDATVLRRGKEEVLKGIKLASGLQFQFQSPLSVVPPVPRTPPVAPAPPKPASNIPPGVAPVVGPFPAPGQQSVMTTNFRTGDRFTSRYQEGSLVITLTGTVKAGKAALGEIHIQDGTANHRFDKVDQVPAQYRDKVNHLIQSATAGDIRIEHNRP